ncbi:hypothetical protein CCACVL1_09255 [Corchorus capsularis]|uniref:Uncharacterized protein n=1 Tax=Corchorus capsularis TaxID=210143 RepID=A0A1R3IX67_COCAP|nr:hypothetical protein CCACVL1_09255 [Corchorus capsularis]
MSRHSSVDFNFSGDVETFGD